MNIAQPVIGSGVLGIDLYDPRVFPRRLYKIVLLFRRLCQFVVRSFMAAIQPNRFLEILTGFGIVILGQVGLPQLEMSLSAVRSNPDQLLQVMQSVLVLAQGRVDASEVVSTVRHRPLGKPAGRTSREAGP